MTTYLDDDPELTALLRSADPVDEDALRRAATSTAADELCGAISTPSVEERQRRRYLRPAIIAATVAAAIATTLVVTLIRPSASQTAYAALVRFAENSPRLLLNDPGWHVSDVQQEDARSGEMTFSSGTQDLHVFWVPGAHEKDSDKLDLTPAGTATIDGQTAFVGYYDSGSPAEFEAIWSVGDQAREARGSFPSKAAFLAAASTLYRVDVTTWLDAMPAWVVKPSARATEIGNMLADIPQPSGLDISKVINNGQVTDLYQLGAQVAGAVSCAWIHQWAHGTPAERQQAIDAMATSRHWAVLLDMQKDGDYPDVVWEIADGMAGKPIQITKGVSLEDWSKPALGC